MKRLIAKIAILTLVFAVFGAAPAANAAALTSMSDTMTRQTISTLSDHQVDFTTPTGVDASTDTITLTFQAGFTMGTVAFGDMDLEVDAACDGTYEISKTLAAAPGVSPTWGAVLAGQVITLTAPTDAAAGEIAATACVRVEIGTNAAGGSNQVTNPATSGSYTIDTAGVFGDSGQLAVPITESGATDQDQVVVTGTVLSTITHTLSAITCALGNITPGNANVDTCSYTSTVTTNATDGYTSTIVAITDGTNEDFNNDADATQLFADPSGGTVDGSQTTTSEYGVGTTDTGVTIATEATCAEDASNGATALSTTAQSYASNTAPAAAEVTTLCHSAAAGTSNPGTGAYTQTVRLIVTGTF